LISGEAQFDAQDGQKQSQKERPRVPHENRGGVEVVAQKTNTGPNQPCRQCAHQNLATLGGQQQKEGSANRRYSTRQAIHVVE